MRLPLRAELGERREDGPLGLGDDVAEQGHRRHELGVADPAQRAVGVGRQLDQHDVGLQLVEGPHAPTAPTRARGGGCRAGAGRAPAATALAMVSPARGRRRRSRPSRRGRAPPPRGTRATRRRRAPGSLTTAPTMPAATSAAPQRAVAEVGGQGQAVGDHRDRLGRRQRARSAAFRLVRPSAVTPSRSSRKIVTTRRISSAAAGHVGQGERGAELADAPGDDRHLLVGVGRQRQHDGVEPPAQRARQLVDAAVAVVGGGDEVEALRPPATSVSSSGTGSTFSDRIVTSASCTSRRHAGELLDAHDRAGAHRPVHGARHQRGLARALGEQAGVVPAVAQRLLGGAGGALHEQRRVAADGRGEVLADPRLGRARHAEQQQGPVGGQRGDGDLDQPPLADVLRRDRGAVGRACRRAGR